jgi:hypothetical protein
MNKQALVFLLTLFVVCLGESTSKYLTLLDSPQSSLSFEEIFDQVNYSVLSHKKIAALEKA